LPIPWVYPERTQSEGRANNDYRKSIGSL
jgi:hypothetical protein